MSSFIHLSLINLWCYCIIFARHLQEKKTQKANLLYIVLSNYGLRDKINVPLWYDDVLFKMTKNNYTSIVPTSSFKEQKICTRVMSTSSPEE